MSSLASLFNSSAMLFTVDFYKKYWPDSSERHLVYVGRIATTVIVILGILWIPVMRGLGKVLYAYLQDVQSLLAPGIASVFLLGVFWKRTTPAAGVTGLVVGFVLGMTRLVFTIFESSVDPNSLWYHMFVAPNWLHYEIVLFFICIASIVIVTLVTRPISQERLVGLTYWTATKEHLKQTKESWNKWDIIHTSIIIAVIMAFYIYFW